MKKKHESIAMPPEQLEAIRAALPELRTSHCGVPFEPLVAIARGAEHGTVTLDLEAERHIGVPVVVVRSCEGAPARNAGTLSLREREVARCIASGLKNAEIARKLGITLATVKDHVHNALRKSGLHTRSALAAALVRGEL